MKRLLFILTILLATGLGSAAETDDVIVIAHPEVDGDAGELRQIYLGKVTRWSDGKTALPVTLEDGDVHKRFLRRYVKKSRSQFTIYWKRALFSGTGSPPRSFESEAEVVAYVAKTKGAVGYVGPETPVENVRILDDTRGQQ